MSVFLIKMSGRVISTDPISEYVQGPRGPTFVDEPLRHHRYVDANPYWKQEEYERRDAWKSASEGDTVLLYCTASVKRHPACISHILPIESKQIEPEGATLKFESPIEIKPKIGLKEITGLVAEGVFSEKMGYCERRGFNFTQVAKSDLEMVHNISTQV